MKLNYNQLTYIIGVLREEKCRAYNAWIDKKFIADKASNAYEDWLKNNPNASKQEKDHAFSKMAEAALSECAESYGVYSIAQTVYQEFTEGEIEI